MKKFFILSCLLFSWISLSIGSDYYFSTTTACPTTGSGTLGSPWGPDPDCDGDNDSFGYVFDGFGTEAACGDTIHLCADTCNGSTSGTLFIPPAPTGSQSNTEQIDFNKDCEGLGTITVQAYCDADSCDQVTITGDLNNDGVHQDGIEANRFTEIPQGELRRNYRIDGDPLNLGLKNLIFKRYRGRFFNNRSDPSNWSFNGVVVQEVGPKAWGPTHIGDTTCSTTTDPIMAFFFSSASWAGPVRITNSTIAHVCSIAIRNQGSNQPTASLLIENVEFFNIQWLSNNYNMPKETWSKIYAHDVDRGLSQENDFGNLVVEDSTFACLGEWKSSSNWTCRYAIGVGPDSEDLDGNMGNVTIRRNKIFGVGSSATPGDSNRGVMRSGIRWFADNDTSSPSWIIENNMIWNILTDQPCNLATPANPSAPIEVEANRPMVVWNNSIYNSKCGIELNTDTGTPVPVVHIVDNNIVVRARGGEELYLSTNAAGSMIRNNNLWDFGAGDTVLDFQSGGTDRTCATIGSHGDGSNICKEFKFVRCDDALGCNTLDSDPRNWNLHLLATDTVNKDAGTSGAADDIDKQTRPQGAGTDIGADEVHPEVVTGPKAKVSGRAQVSGQVKVQ